MCSVLPQLSLFAYTSWPYSKLNYFKGDCQKRVFICYSWQKNPYFNTAFTHKDRIYLNSLDNVYILMLHMVYTVFCDHFLQEIISLLSSLGVNLLVVFNLISFQMLMYIYFNTTIKQYTGQIHSTYIKQNKCVP